MRKSDALEMLKNNVPASQAMEILNESFRGMETQLDIEKKDVMIIEWDLDKFFNGMAEALTDEEG